VKHDFRRPVYRTFAEFSRGYLPHRDPPGAFQFVTLKLSDAGVPRSARRPHGFFSPEETVDPSAEGRDARRFFAEYEAELHAGRGACLLANPACAAIIVDVLDRFASKDYRLLAWVVMPNHVHALIALTSRRRLSAVVRRWKKSSAIAINRLLRRRGRVWLPEYFDRVIESPDACLGVRDYIELNPVQAGIATTALDWPYSSIHTRVAGAEGAPEA